MNYYRYHIFCGKCGAAMPCEHIDEIAISHWNSRAKMDEKRGGGTVSEEDKKMLTSLWKTISAPKYYELRDQAWQLIDFLQRVEKAECGFPTAPVPAPSGLDWIDPTKPTPKYSYSTTTTPNEEWQKSVRYI